MNDFSSNKEVNLKSFDLDKSEDKTANDITRKRSKFDILNSSELDPKYFPSMVQIDIKKEKEDIDLIKSALSNHFLFRDQAHFIMYIKDNNSRDKIIEKISLIEIEQDTILFKEEDEGKTFYIVKAGILEIDSEDSNTPPKYLKTGDILGEVALIHDYKRTSSVKCIEKAQLYFLLGWEFRITIIERNKHKLQDRIFFLSLIKLFAGLNKVQLHNIALSMLKCFFKINETIIKEGEVGDSIYIIQDGQIKCVSDTAEVRELSKKDYFGESAILFGHKRSMSVVTLSKTICFQISSSCLIECLGVDYKTILLRTIAKESFRNSKYMSLLIANNYFDTVFPCLTQRIYKDGDIVIDKDENINDKKIVLCIEGNLHFDSNYKEIIATRGDLFGDIFIKNKESLKYNIVANSNCRTLETTWENIITKINLDIEFEHPIEGKNILKFLSILSHLKKNHLLRFTSDSRLLNLCKRMNKESFQKGEIIFKEEEIGEKLYLIKKGKVRVMKDDKYTREVEEGNCFGEVSLLVNQPRSATIVAKSKVITYTLSKTDFIAFIDKKMFEFLTNKISLLDNFSTTLDDLYFVKNLGQGKFGSVALVHNRKILYAIKAVKIKSAEHHKILITHLIHEKNILLSIDHPFIMKLVKTMKNDEYIFFLTEYIKGQTLRKYLDDVCNNKVIGNKSAVQFYMAILLIAVDYLNSKSISHRDIKPENIMVDSKGYLKLIDFGSAIVIKDYTSTITGTPHYVAPEVLNGKGYSFSCDYWTIGIIAYEMYFDCYPFGQNANDPIDIYREIMQKDLHITKDFCEDKSISNFMNLLLKKQVSHRVCTLEMIKQLDFFFDFKWNGVIDFSISAPYIPYFKPDSGVFESELKYLEKLAMKKNSCKDLIDFNSVDPNHIVNYSSNWAENF